MSTRANVVVTDGFAELIFYRHSDGFVYTLDIEAMEWTVQPGGEDAE